jgi:hypothetical protein
MPFSDPPSIAAYEHRDAATGFEVAVFRAAGDGTVIDGQTCAVEDGEAYAVAYTIEVDARWRTRRAHVRNRTGAGRRETRIETDGDGRWTVDGTPTGELDGVLDVDLEASALTNTLPVRRLGLKPGAGAAAPAAYVRALDLRVERLDQEYTRLDDGAGGGARFDYRCKRFDFRCILEYDRAGLVLAYPGIAVRRA